MSFERKELASGIYFNAIRENKFKAGVISVRFIMPLTAGTAAKNALLFPVLLRGSENFPNLASIRKEEESIYDTAISDSVYKRGDDQILELRLNLLDNRFAIDGMNIEKRAMALLSDILFHPLTENGVFVREYVESEKQKLIDDIASQVNDKRRYAMTRLVETMFPKDKHGLSELGTEVSVSMVCPTCLFKAYQALLQTAKVEIFAVGNFDFAALADAFTADFKTVDRRYTPFAKTVPMKEPTGEIKKVYEHQNIAQGKLALGFYTGALTTDKDYHVMQVLNSVFGSGVTSKLFLNVREKLSLCYYCASGDNGQKGYMAVHSGIEFQNEKKAVDEILFQLSEIQNGHVTEEELENAKLSLLDALARVDDSVGNILSWYFAGVMNGYVMTPEEKRTLLLSVTVDDIVKKSKDIKLDTYYFLCGKEDEKA